MYKRQQVFSVNHKIQTCRREWLQYLDRMEDGRLPKVSFPYKRRGKTGSEMKRYSEKTEQAKYLLREVRKKKKTTKIATLKSWKISELSAVPLRHFNTGRIEYDLLICIWGIYKWIRLRKLSISKLISAFVEISFQTRIPFTRIRFINSSSLCAVVVLQATLSTASHCLFWFEGPELNTFSTWNWYFHVN